MSSSLSLYEGAGAALGVLAAERYFANSMSVFCPAVVGLIATFEMQIVGMLPYALIPKSPLPANLGIDDILVSVAGGLCFEATVRGGTLRMLLTVQGAQNFAIGAGAALAGYMAGKYAERQMAPRGRVAGPTKAK